MKDEIRPIDLITTDDLIDELTRRTSPSVFIGEHFDEDGSKMMRHNSSANKGYGFGLCAQMMYNYLREMVRQEINGALYEKEE
jgi:hypothetical protein